VINSYGRNPITGRVELHGVTRDVTARKRAEAKLRESETRFRVLFEQAGLAIVVFNNESAVVECNQRALEAFRCRAADLIGAYPWDYSPPTQPDGSDSKEVTRTKILAALENGPQSFEWTYRRLDQTVFPADVALNAVRTENDVLVFGIIRDITERKRAERERERLQEQVLQSQKMEAVGRLAGGVAHDFNNLLGVIMGRAELILADLAQEHPFREELESILEAADRSAGLTRQLLAFARKQTIAPRVINLNGSVDGTLKMLRRLLSEDIELIWRPGEALAEVMMDPSQLDQILANLCVNARDAMQGGGKVIIETANIELDEAYCAGQTDLVPGSYVMLALSDNGNGMPEEVLSQIFEPFFTTKPVGKGTGLGLSTVYGIVRQNHAAIRAHSSPGIGTTFKIFFPQAQSTTPTSGPSLPQAHTRGSGETLLLVEDEPALCGVIQTMLERFGYKVLSTTRPSLAVEIARAHGESIALLVTDVIMPGMNGRELFSVLAGFLPELKCLYLSGYTADIIAQHGVLDGSAALLAKPFTANALAAKIFEALSPRKAR
jgi:two-component system, cell cycle sensor histidine kinase and response regulator CckA